MLTSPRACAGLFIIVYAFVTVLAALIRWAVLKKQLFGPSVS